MNDYTYNNIESSRREYEALPSSEWRKDYFNEENGGYLVTHRKRIKEAEKSNQEKRKLSREHQICLVFAKEGHRIMHLPDRKEKGEGTYDAIFDNRKADLKKTKSATNIVKYASRATRQQGAQIVLFEFEEWNSGIRNAISETIRKNIHGFFFVSGKTKTHEF